MPIRLEVDPRPPYNRRTVLFRLPLLIPAWWLFNGFVGPLFYKPESPLDRFWVVVTGFAPGLLSALALGTGAMIAFRGRYPRWWFDAHAEIVRFGVRFLAYAFLITDAYPSTDRETDVRVLIEIPPTESVRNRWLALFKPLLVVPHVWLLVVATGFACWATIFAWFAAVLGRRPSDLHYDFVVGVLRYGLVIYAYAFLHLTDRYPRIGDGPQAYERGL